MPIWATLPCLGDFRDAIGRNPDDDQNYLALGLLEFRENHVADANKHF